jgi:DNA mismatch repair protein MutL
MSEIVKLPKEVSDKIAAGEVVTGPLSVVKELVENSIDAEAAQISVEIEKGGKTFIRVTDDGKGIAADDIKLAFEPHATSKITSDKDLDKIATLGFRGEALASIAAVARLEMTTKTAREKVALKVSADGGEISDIEETGAPDGTAMTVRDLFYNTPARRKFMKSDRAETAAIADFMSRVAVAYPDRKIRFATNGAVLFATPGRGDRMRAILTAFGAGAGDGLIPITADNAEADAASAERTLKRGAEKNGGPRGSADITPMKMTAWISDPSHSAKTRKNQVFFVNGRYIKDETLSGAVRDAYKEFMFEGRYPHIFMFLEISPETVDVNVHPTKSEVKFADAALVRDFVKDAITRTLMSSEGVPQAQTAKQFAAARRAERDYYSINDDSAGATQTDAIHSHITQPVIARNEVTKQSTHTPSDDSAMQGGESGEYAEVVNISGLWSKSAVRENVGSSDVYGEHRGQGGTIDISADGSAGTETGGQGDSADISAEGSAGKRTGGESGSPDMKGAGAPEGAARRGVQREIRIEYLAYIGSVFGSYIVASDDEHLYLVDWHAAHERVNFEKLLEQYRADEKLRQSLLAPEVISIPAAARPYTEKWAKWLTDAGFEAEIFGGGSLIIKAVPAFLSAGEALRYVNDLIESAGKNPPDNDRAVERLISRACRSSVMANANIRKEDATALLKSLSKCKNPYTCPHGRPVFIKYTKHDLEKLFKRA